MGKADLTRVLHGYADLTLEYPEHRIALPVTDWTTRIEDALLSVYGQPAVLPVASTTAAPLVSVAGLRIFLGDASRPDPATETDPPTEEDITGPITQILRTSLSGEGGKLKKELRGLYGRALQRWHEFSKQMDHIYTPDKLASDSEAVDELPQGVVADALADLGDRETGAHGNLHLFNFLYRDIPVKPVSLVEALGGGGRGLGRLRAFRYPTLRFAHGPSYPRGRLVYTLEMVYSNPLEEILEEVKTMIEAMNEELIKQFSYLDRIENKTLVTLNSLKGKMDEATRRLQAIEDDIEHLGVRRPPHDR